MSQAAHNNLSRIFSKQTMRKVPEVIIIFWIIKLLTTAMGESTSDFFVYAINPYLAVIGSGVILAIALILQLSVKRYIAWIYWFAVVMVAVFGTMAADVMHIVLGVPYLDSTIFFALILLFVFVIWYRCEKTLSIHSINSRRRELFYWATVMATFALGTAAGDMTASTLNLGYFPSAMLFLILFAIPAVAWKFFKLTPIVSFWFAYIITRPLGASFADWFGKPFLGGLGLGDGKVSIVLTILIIIFVGYLSITKIDIKDKQ
jgi:uncharacterized membrane-anchored protein